VLRQTFPRADGICSQHGATPRRQKLGYATYDLATEAMLAREERLRSLAALALEAGGDAA
jgi:hypothetical protein